MQAIIMLVCVHAGSTANSIMHATDRVRLIRDVAISTEASSRPR